MITIKNFERLLTSDKAITGYSTLDVFLPVIKKLTYKINTAK
jgi:hypothetical protein